MHTYTALACHLCSSHADTIFRTLGAWIFMFVLGTLIAAYTAEVRHGSNVTEPRRNRQQLRASHLAHAC